MVTLLLAVMTTAAAWAQNTSFPTTSGGEGTETDPYIIANSTDLNLLASDVNSGTLYKDKYFKMTADITYDTTKNNNFIAIGSRSSEYSFLGKFDGNGYKISGIRISVDKGNIGVFGILGEGAKVENITLDDAIITGKSNTGGIVGNNRGGTVTNCHVSSSVNINTTSNDVNCHGGIVGYNKIGTVSYCTSAATLTIAAEVEVCDYYAAIAGQNDKDGNLSHNLAIKATIPASTSSTGHYYGAITGCNTTNDPNVSGTLEYNYYSGCTVGGVANATNVGCGNTNSNPDVTVKDGAVSATILSETEPVPSPLSGKVVFMRDFKAGIPSTIILPFEYTPVAGEGTYYTFAGIEKKTENEKTIYEATMTANTTAKLAANTPYLFKASGTDSHKPILYQGEAAYDASNLSTTMDLWAFKGTYSRLTYGTTPMTGHVYGFASKTKMVDGIEVQAGEFVHAKEGASIPTLRCYLIYNNGDEFTGTRGNSEELPECIAVKFVNTLTGIVTVPSPAEAVSGSAQWYSLDGRRLSGKPSAKGLYIFKGKKVVIK